MCSSPIVWEPIPKTRVQSDRQLMDDAVGTLFQLPDVVAAVLGDFAAGAGNDLKFEGSSDQTPNQVIGGLGSIFRDLGVDLLQPRLGTVGPNGLHSASPNSRNTASARVTRPTALSARPASISLQTTAW